jgi:N-hydroxyarylamine O-acetyltransferase
MEQTSPNLSAYLRRVGFAGKPGPSLATLRELHRLHTRAIPFENLSPFLGERVRLDLASLEDKMVARGRGGWCFEHNLLFTHVLRAIGFEVKTLAARVRWNVPAGVTPARSHMLMLVSADDGLHVADVGFGGLTLTAPLRFEPDVEQETPHEPHRLASEGERLVLQAKLAEEWHDLYAFDLYEQIQPDYEVSNWYLSTWPESQFVKGIVAARADHDARHVLRNTRYQVHHRGRESERRHLATVEAVKAVLSGPLGIPLPAHPELDARLQRMIDANPDR